MFGGYGKKRKTCANEMRTVDVGKLHSKSASQPTGRITIGLILSGNSIPSEQVLCSSLFRTNISSSDFLFHPKRRVFSTIKNLRRCTRSDVLTEQESWPERRSEIKYAVRTFYLCYSRVRPHPADFGSRISGPRQDPSRQYCRRYSAVQR